MLREKGVTHSGDFGQVSSMQDFSLCWNKVLLFLMKLQGINTSH